MAKLDLKKKFKALYAPSADAVVRVEVPPLGYLMLDGEGDPNTSPAYAHAVEALFSTAYAIKFAVKRGPSATDYGVMPLEGLWWADDMSRFTVDKKAEWKWTMMTMQPDTVTPDLVNRAVAEIRRKKNLVALDRIRFEVLEEGICVQTMHLGPFSEEGPTVARVHQFVTAHGSLRGRHHEIYLTDIRKADPRKWKTVIRQPMTER
jgi:hypothetical protein